MSKAIVTKTDDLGNKIINYYYYYYYMKIISSTSHLDLLLLANIIELVLELFQ